MNYRELLKEFLPPIFDRVIKKDKTKKLTVGSIVEFELYDGFNESNTSEALKNIVDLYIDVLHKDPKWHAFFEGKFIVIRCCDIFANDVIEFLKRKEFTNYKGPKEWQEGTYVTKRYKHAIFTDLFHTMSENAMTLIMDDETKDDYDYYVEGIAERIIHAWFNYNLLASIAFGKIIKDPIDCQMWEAMTTSKLALARARFAGKYEYIKNYQKNSKENQANK
jgi:hypothetical protein